MSRIFLPHKTGHSRMVSGKGSIRGAGGFGDILLGSPTNIDDPVLIKGTGLGDISKKIGELKVKSVGRKHRNINFNM